MPVAAPRIDERLVRFIEGSPIEDSAASITRAVGDLAWQLGLARPSYQQVRILAAGRRARRSRQEIALKVIETMYEYPGPGLAGWYQRWQRGEV